MKKYFSFDRFVKYFKYDVTNAKSNYGLSALITGLLPVFTFLVVNLFSLVINGHWTDGDASIPIIAFSVAIVISIFTAGNKLYGSLTEKKAGSNWLLIPASTLEKTISMILITCILVPAFIGILLVASDLLLQVLPGYGGSLVVFLREEVLGKAKDAGVTVNAIGLIWTVWAASLLFFTLGAVFFKKSKAAKTFLAAMVITSVFGSIFGTLASNNPGLFESLADFIGSGSDNAVMVKVNLMINLYNIVKFIVIGGGLYWRLKTLKH